MFQFINNIYFIASNWSGRQEIILQCCSWQCVFASSVGRFWVSFSLSPQTVHIFIFVITCEFLSFFLGNIIIWQLMDTIKAHIRHRFKPFEKDILQSKNLWWNSSHNSPEAQLLFFCAFFALSSLSTLSFSRTISSFHFYRSQSLKSLPSEFWLRCIQ